MSDEIEARPVETIESMVEAEVAQELRPAPGAGEIIDDVKRDVEDYVKVNPWTSLFAAGLVGAILAMIITG